MFPHRYLFVEVSTHTKIRKRNRGLCVSYKCQRVTDGNNLRCGTCRSRLSRLRRPDRYAFAVLRESARKRGIPFLLTFEEFKAFCDKTGYVEKKGKTPQAMTVDRIDSKKPYQADNIRPMSWIDNCSHKFENQANDDDGNPF